MCTRVAPSNGLANGGYVSKFSSENNASGNPSSFSQLILFLVLSHDISRRFSRKLNIGGQFLTAASRPHAHPQYLFLILGYMRILTAVLFLK